VIGGPVHGLAAIRSAFRENFPSSTSMGTLEQSDVQVRALGDEYALALGKYHLTRPHKDGGEATGSFTEILEKTPAGWRVVFSENT
jgi:ketosteroid isomerase-like protein